MNNIRRALLLFSLALISPVGYGAIVIQPNEANADVIDESYNRSIYDNDLSVGDFNGDGRDDVAVVMTSTVSQPLHLFFAPFSKDQLFSTQSSGTLVSGGTDISLSLPSRRMADLDQDGKDDLIVLRKKTGDPQQLKIVRGTSQVGAGGLLDLESGTTVGVPPGGSLENKVAVGDYNGDGKQDLAMLLSISTSSECFFLLGGENVLAGSVDLSDSNALPRVHLDGYGTTILTGNFDHQLGDDLAFALQRQGREDISLFWSRNPFPNAGGIPPSSDVEILASYEGLGGHQTFFFPLAAGDLTGDHKDELIVQGRSFEQFQWILDGSDLSSGRPILRQQTGTAESVVFYPVDASDIGMFGKSACVTDFDGDGTSDLFSANSYGIGGRFTTTTGSPGLSLGNLGSVSLGWTGRFAFAASGDFNADGFQDMVSYENFMSIYSPFGAIRFLFGFRPLTNPRINLLALPTDRLRARLAFSVDGDPVDMRLSGDVVSERKDRWVPFVFSDDVPLSPGGGTKTVNVQYRNAVGRESASAQIQIPVTVQEPRVVTDTNRLRPGGTVSFDCHVPAPGPLRAWVYGPDGRRVTQLADDAVDAGIYPVSWDGTNSHGNRVTRGVYILVIEINGDKMKKEILVE